MSDPRFSFLNNVTGSDAGTLSEFTSRTTIRITVSSEANASFAGQVLIYQLATLTTRLFDDIELIGDDAIPCDNRMVLLTGSFLPALRALLPTLRPITKTSSVATNLVDVVVGRTAKTAGAIYLGSSDWSAFYSTNEPQCVNDASNPIGALAAGTLGASEVFKYVFKGKLQGAVNSSGYILSMLDYNTAVASEPQLPEKIDVDATLFGCGSIGCGLLLGVLLTPQLHGKFVTVDNGRFDTKNPYKYALLDWTTAQQASFKAVWSQQQVLKHTKDRLTARAFVGTAETYVASLSHDYKLPLAISAVDTIEARFEIQDTLPRHVVNAGIEGTLAMVSVHGFGGEACLACLGMQTDLESWNAKPIADATGLSPERVHELIRRNEELTHEDLELIKTRSAIANQLSNSIDTFLGQPLLSLMNRVAYSEAAVNVGVATPIQAKVTTAFVSAFAGVLLLSEVIKQSVPELQSYAASNSYQQQLLGIPAGGTFKHQREAQGWCLCHSSYRQSLYAEKYLT